MHSSSWSQIWQDVVLENVETVYPAKVAHSSYDVDFQFASFIECPQTKCVPDVVLSM